MPSLNMSSEYICHFSSLLIVLWRFHFPVSMKHIGFRCDLQYIIKSDHFFVVSVWIVISFPTSVSTLSTIPVTVSYNPALPKVKLFTSWQGTKNFTETITWFTLAIRPFHVRLRRISSFRERSASASASSSTRET